MLQTLRELLEKAGYKVRVAPDLSLIVVDKDGREYMILVAETVRQPRITRFRTGDKTEMLRIRCSKFTMELFYKFADSMKAGTLEEALLWLLREKVVPMFLS